MWRTWTSGVFHIKMANGKASILSLVDAATRYAVCRSVNDESSGELIKAIERGWIKVIGGQSAVKGDLKASTLLDQLVAKLRAGEGDNAGGPATPAKYASAAAGVSAIAAAVAGEGARDPMAALLGVIQGASKSKKGPARGDPEKSEEKPK